MNKIFISDDSEVAQAIKILGDDEYIACDTETAGLSHWENTLWSVQVGNQKDSFLFPYNALNSTSRKLLREYMVDKIWVCHNAQFDYKFLRLNGFEAKGLYCTYDTEKILYTGKYFTYKLKDLVFRRFQIELSKEERKEFYDGTFSKLVGEFGDWGAWETSPHLIEYALNDIDYLLEIRDQQLEEAKGFGMTGLVDMENAIIKDVVNMELRGVYFDKEEAKKFQSVISERRDILGAEIFTQLGISWEKYWAGEFARRMELHNKWKLKHQAVVAKSNKLRQEGDKRKKTEEALAMVEKSKKKMPFSTLPSIESEFNPRSPLKLKMALTGLIGFEVPTTNKEWLEENILIHPVIEELMEHRKLEKTVSVL